MRRLAPQPDTPACVHHDPLGGPKGHGAQGAPLRRCSGARRKPVQLSREPVAAERDRRAHRVKPTERRRVGAELHRPEIHVDMELPGCVHARHRQHAALRAPRAAPRRRVARRNRDAAAGRGAGRTQGSVLAVASVDAPRKLHVDVNLGPVELGADASPLRWFHSVGAAVALGRYGLTTELYGLTAGAGASAEWGALGAVTFRPAEWIVVDAGGSVGLWRETPHLVFVGVTTNLGAVFK